MLSIREGAKLEVNNQKKMSKKESYPNPYVLMLGLSLKMSFEMSLECRDFSNGSHTNLITLRISGLLLTVIYSAVINLPLLL